MAVVGTMIAKNGKELNRLKDGDLGRRKAMHQKFLEEMYKEQTKGNRYFVHEAVEQDITCGRRLGRWTRRSATARSRRTN